MEGHACQGLQLAIHAKMQGIIMSDSVILSKMKFNCANILILTCTYELKQRAENLTALTVIRRVLRQFYKPECVLCTWLHHAEELQIERNSRIATFLFNRGAINHTMLIMHAVWSIVHGYQVQNLYFIPHMRCMWGRSNLS